MRKQLGIVVASFVSMTVFLCSCSIEADLAPDKAISAFAIVSPPAYGVINDSTKTITVTVPYGTEVTSLIATFATTGISVTANGVEQTSGITANDFRTVVIYTVTAENGSTSDYTVSVLNLGLETLMSQDMASVPGGTYIQRDETNSFSHTLSAFFIAKYEVTYELWYAVRIWALDHGYNFQNQGRQGRTVDAQGSSPGIHKYEPVVSISWRDSIVWCNAYSEASGLTPVYYFGGEVLKDSRDANAISCDGVSMNTVANGYSLPIEGEWQYAASFQNGFSWAPWNCVSGGSVAFSGTNSIDFPYFEPFAWFGDTVNAPVGNATQTNDVGLRAANQLGIYDMSGNVNEWCWDWYAAFPTTAKNNYRGPGSDTGRIVKGGSYFHEMQYLRIGDRQFRANPNSINDFQGFRLVRH